MAERLNITVERVGGQYVAQWSAGPEQATSVVAAGSARAAMRVAGERIIASAEAAERAVRWEILPGTHVNVIVNNYREAALEVTNVVWRHRVARFKALAQLRQVAGLTVEQIAEVLELSPQRVRQLLADPKYEEEAANLKSAAPDQ